MRVKCVCEMGMVCERGACIFCFKMYCMCSLFACFVGCDGIF